MTCRITGLAPDAVVPLYGLTDADLAARGARRVVADSHPGYPDRIEMRDARPGETLLLVNHVSQPAPTPYRASHAIFVREGATERFDRVGEVPEVFRPRILSLRAFDADGMMIDADLVDGGEVERLIDRLLSDPATAAIHVHNAKRGCYAGLVERAP